MPKKDPKRSSVIEDNLMLNVIKKYLKLAGGVSAVWLMGYYGVSVSWIWIVLVPYVWKNRLTKAKKHKTAISQEVARDEKAVILARVEDLPSWVYFPDVERAEWVNKILSGNYESQESISDGSEENEVEVGRVARTASVEVLGRWNRADTYTPVL
ncbi:extended synaptotagmin-like protein 2 [Plakobranchus ocellatus]|uniref:Extended synaptotagmin-like protein 2 n=1 Tax=Plakobranchus ocellatus TaxID=259542 RepID=A0AAV3Z557_9GAST|nr:extended synaptotagmin-like protein 2 [Plakobranchus ocellatus]